MANQASAVWVTVIVLLFLLLALFLAHKFWSAKQAMGMETSPCAAAEEAAALPGIEAEAEMLTSESPMAYYANAGPRRENGVYGGNSFTGEDMFSSYGGAQGFEQMPPPEMMAAGGAYDMPPMPQHFSQADIYGPPVGGGFVDPHMSHMQQYEMIPQQ